jgi:DNA modification methylase
MPESLLLLGNALHIPLADNSVQCCVTSPPYWGLRSYDGDQEQIWGGDPACVHEWAFQSRTMQTGGVSEKQQSNRGITGDGWKATDGFCSKCGAWYGPLGLEPTPELFVEHLVMIFREVRRVLHPSGTLWLNLGDSYARLPSRGQKFEGGSFVGSDTNGARTDIRMNIPQGLKEKDMVGIPWMVAFALRADGWYLRSAPPWIKGNCMPESVTDRFTTAHEYWFMLTKSERYFADPDAIRVPNVREWIPEKNNPGKINGNSKSQEYGIHPGEKRSGAELAGFKNYNPAGRNYRTSDVFYAGLDGLINDTAAYLAHLKHVRENGGALLSPDGLPVAMLFSTKPFSGAHFATFSPDMIEPLIKFSTSEAGCCSICGKPWERGSGKRSDIIYSPSGTGCERVDPTMTTGRKGMNRPRDNDGETRPITVHQQREYAKQLRYSRHRAEMEQEAGTAFNHYIRTDASGARPVPQDLLDKWLSRGWLTPVEFDETREQPAGFRPTCAHDAPAVVPCTVLDPFNGSGTTGLVAQQLGRNYVGLDLSAEYLDLARERIGLKALDEWQNGKAAKATVTDDLPLFQVTKVI